MFRKVTLLASVMLAFGLIMIFNATPAAADSTVNAFVTAQRYEYGLMVWRSDTGGILIFYDDQRMQYFPLEQYTWLPDNPSGSSGGRLRPVNGFGKVWGNYASVRQDLGWPIVPEIGYMAQIIQTPDYAMMSQISGQYLWYNGRTWQYQSQPVPPPPQVGMRTFSASPDPADPGATITLTWEIVGDADMALIEMYDASKPESAGPLASTVNLPLSGSTTFDLPTDLTARGAMFVLYAVNDSGVPSPNRYTYLTRSETAVTVQRSDTVHTHASFQQFEDGFMIWRQDTGDIHVFYGTINGEAVVFSVQWYSYLPDNPYWNVPPGRVRPILGIGKVWGSVSSVRDRLGWAMSNEQGFRLTVRSTPVTVPAPPTLAFDLPDGRIITIRGNQWSLQ